MDNYEIKKAELKIQVLSSVAGAKGEEGESMYEIAKKNGFEGTEQEFIAQYMNVNARIGCYECDTDSSTSAKTVQGGKFILPTIPPYGGTIKVKFKYKNSAANPTLSISGCTAKPLYYDGAIASSTNTWADNETVDIYYDGTNFYANNVEGGGKFASGEKVKNVGIDSEPTAGSENLVKSGGVAKVNGYNAETNTSYIRVIVDSNNRILFGIKNDGSVVWSVGIPEPVKKYIDDSINEIKDGSVSLEIDGLNKIIAFLDDFSTSNTLKNLLDGKVDKVEGKGLSKNDFTDSNKETLETFALEQTEKYIKVVVDNKNNILEGIEGTGKKIINIPVSLLSNNIFNENSQYLYVLTDNDNKIIYGITKEGDVVFGYGVPEQIKKYVRDTIIGGTSIIELNDPIYTEKALKNLKRPSRESGTPIYTPFVILHFSDLHADLDALKRVIDYKNYYSNYIDEALLSGDIVANYYDQGINFYTETEGATSILLAVGNHDTAKYENGVYNWTYYVGQASYDRYIKDFAANWGITPVINKCYYYKDYSDYKLRMVVIDCMEGATTDQVSWFTNTALNVPTYIEDGQTKRYALFCVSHYPYNRTKVTHIDCPFDSRQGHLSDSTPDAFIDAVEDFIDNGGEFVCWLTGHTHRDYLCTVNNKKQIVITIDTASVSRSNHSDTERIVGTKTQDLFNLVAIDTYQKIIKVMRVGANMDSWLRSKNTMSIQYASNTNFPNITTPQLIQCN